MELECKWGDYCRVAAVTVAILGACGGLIVFFLGYMLMGLSVLMGSALQFLIFRALAEALYQGVQSAYVLQQMQYQLTQLQQASVPQAQPAPREQAAPPAASGSAQVRGEQKTAHFSRSDLGEYLECPFCKTRQRSERKLCFSCAAEFVLDD